MSASKRARYTTEKPRRTRAPRSWLQNEGAHLPKIRPGNLSHRRKPPFMLNIAQVLRTGRRSQRCTGFIQQASNRFGSSRSWYIRQRCQSHSAISFLRRKSITFRPSTKGLGLITWLSFLPIRALREIIPFVSLKRKDTCVKQPSKLIILCSMKSFFLVIVRR